MDRKKIISDVVTCTIVIIIGAIVYLGICVILPNLKSEDKNYTRIKEAIDKVSTEYVEPIQTEKIIDNAIKGIMESANDPYTRYLSDEEYNSIVNSGNEQYCGLGIHITYNEENNGIIILSIMPSSPALEEGLKTGDIILKVGDLGVSAENYQECVDKIKGIENSKVKLTISRDKQIFEKEYTRKKIIPNNVESNIIDNIGYIKILSFDNNVATQFEEQYNILVKKKVKGLIIDVRNNPGGILSEVTKICDLLLPKCEIVKLVDRNNKEKIYNSDDIKKNNIPLVILANDRSASASEILAGAIKDNNAGKIVGIKTYGKGIVQTIEKLEGGGAISITTSKYYTSSGNVIHKNGILPDIEVKLDKKYESEPYIPIDKDLQLNKALEILK
ncbi:MAG: S41 family peptidase [Clostridia bacterium]